jgi:hypothetical protein
MKCLCRVWCERLFTGWHDRVPEARTGSYVGTPQTQNWKTVSKHITHCFSFQNGHAYFTRQFFLRHVYSFRDATLDSIVELRYNSTRTRQPPLPSLGRSGGSKLASGQRKYDLLGIILEVDLLAARDSDSFAQASLASPSTVATTPASTHLP